MHGNTQVHCEFLQISANEANLWDPLGESHSQHPISTILKTYCNRFELMLLLSVLMCIESPVLHHSSVCAGVKCGSNGSLCFCGYTQPVFLGKQWLDLDSERLVSWRSQRRPCNLAVVFHLAACQTAREADLFRQKKRGGRAMKWRQCWESKQREKHGACFFPKPSWFLSETAHLFAVFTPPQCDFGLMQESKCLVTGFVSIAEARRITTGDTHPIKSN